jgi:prepilin-type N-terminal cleavage/methylation domain-containing protein
MMLLRNEKGFTLVEIAIVLIVVTLLLGGVMVGGSAVMENARTASLIGQIKDLAAASRDFKSRYGYYPGDLPNAGTLITTDGGVSAGCSYAVSATVGNGIVNSTTESRCALEHLVKSRMLSKVELSGSNYRIPHPFGGGEVSLWYTASNENAVRVTNLPCKIALQVDSKLDNSSATPLATGLVTAFGSGGETLGGCVAGGNNDPVAITLLRY